MRIVFAESCTAGLASAQLAQVPGISDWMCGSAVTYRESVKQDWLGIDAAMLAKHTAVSAAVTRQMSEQVLRRTPEADLSVAVTGHLEVPAAAGPCHAWIGTSFRESDSILPANPARFELDGKNRVARQWQAACLVLEMAVKRVKMEPSGE